MSCRRFECLPPFLKCSSHPGVFWLFNTPGIYELEVVEER